MGLLTTGLITQLKVLYMKEYNKFENEYTRAFDKLVMKESRPQSKIDDVIQIRYPAIFESMKEWKQGEQRPGSNNDVYKSSLTIKNWGIDITIDEDDIKNGDILKVEQRIVSHAQSEKQHFPKLLMQMIASGTANTYGTGMGEQVYFLDTHALGDSGTIDNLLAIDLSAANMNTIYAHFANEKDERGKYLGLIPTVIVCAPALRATALGIAKLQKNIVVTDAVNMLYQGELDVIENPYITDTNAWACFVTGQPDTAPFVFVEKEAVVAEVDVSKIYGQEKISYGVKTKGNIGYGDWRLAVYSAGSS